MGRAFDRGSGVPGPPRLSTRHPRRADIGRRATRARTADLALTAIAEKLAPRAVNVHFQDSFEEGSITFDYRMRSGAVTRSNALALMRAGGLEVASPTPVR
jgi:hypothetical protein